MAAEKEKARLYGQLTAEQARGTSIVTPLFPPRVLHRARRVSVVQPSISVMASSDAEMDGAPRVKFAQPQIIQEEGFVYDPDQNPDEKRQLRKNYRSLNKYSEGTSWLIWIYQDIVEVKYRQIESE